MDVHGLRDSIRNGLTGILAKDPKDASIKAIELLKNHPDRYQAMAEQCLIYA